MTYRYKLETIEPLKIQWATKIWNFGYCSGLYEFDPLLWTYIYEIYDSRGITHKMPYDDKNG
jgi:hypothetical protein